MYQLQYIVPDGYPPVNASLDESVRNMCARLKGVDTKGARVPNSALSVQLRVTKIGATVGIEKRDQPVYLNFFCFESHHFAEIFSLVEEFYHRYDLGVPRRPKIPTWIHSIPIAQDILRENEIILSQKMTVSFFWAAYAQHLKKSNPLN